jgi:hypothetical protein
MSDWLIDELRVSGPAPSDELRARVRAIGAPPPRSARRRRWLLAVPATVAVSLGLATVQVLRDDAPQTTMSAGEARQAPRALEPWTTAPVAADSQTSLTFAQGAAGSVVVTRAGVAPSQTRAQRYRADIVVHVDDNAQLANATARAMQLTRNVGGYLVSASQGTSADGSGRSALVVRIPTGKVQHAIVRFAQLGTILRQAVEVQDLQRQLDQLFQQAQQLRAQITALEAQPPSVERDRKLRLLRLRLDDLTGRSKSVQRTASFARVALTLTTAETAAIAPKPHEPGRIERAWHRAVDVLAQEVVIALYAFVVAGPLVLLAGLAWLGARGGRRRSREALLERS